MKIALVAYTDEWPLAFEIEKKKITTYIQQTSIVAYIEHIGSTSVQGLLAKPIIDMMIGLEYFDTNASVFVQIMTQAGYYYNNNYEHLMPFRRFFQYSTPNLSYNIHTVQYGSEFWERHLLFRDYLRLFDKKRNLYAAHKLALANRDWNNTAEYANAKTPFIRQLEQEARSYFGHEKLL